VSVVQKFPSLQLSFGVNTHPVAELHESSVQPLLSLQTTLVIWVQAPVAVLQVSAVQALLSLQRVAASAHLAQAGSDGHAVQFTKF